MLTILTNLLSDESGATAIEYAFIAGLVSMAAVAAFKTIGTSLSSTFNTVASSF